MVRSEATSALDLSSPVFIIGGSRTGSEMLKTMLSASPEVDFVDELFLYCPRWLHKDLSTYIREYVGRLDAKDALDKLLDFLYSGVPYGWFWSVVESELDRASLRVELRRGPLNHRSLLRSIMSVHAQVRGKSGIGAKFPVHYSYTDKLLEWFPKCRLIHTTRNPKGVYASQAAKYTTGEQNLFSRSYSRFQQFAHINIQTAWTARLHETMRVLPNYRLIRYEDVVSKPEETTRRLCEFLEIPFMQQMLEPNQYGSSFRKTRTRRGIETSSVNRWHNKISRISALTLDVAHRRAYRILGYHLPYE